MTRKILVLAASAFAALFVASTYAEKSTSETFDDSSLATKTKEALIQEKNVSANDINVEVYKGRVQLAGFVKSEEQKAAAIAATEKVQGVTKVLDGLVVMPGKRSFGQTFDDQTLQTKLKAKLMDQEGWGKGFDINTEVRQGEVLMSGFVPDEQHRTKADEVAQKISGVKKVHNKIELKSE